MMKLKIALAVAIVLSLAAFDSPRVAALAAQEKSSTAPASSEKLTEQESRGEGLFLQRCSICHLSRNLKFGSPPTAGPPLNGQFKAAGPDQLKLLRGFILKGGPDMPGFQFGLDAKQIDDLIAYLKTQ
jgi:mono/diheme cytochrome c family protein